MRANYIEGIHVISTTQKPSEKLLHALTLYLVLDADVCGDEKNMLATAVSAVKAGVTMIQLRATHWKKKRWLSMARLLKSALINWNVPLIINDHVDVAMAVDAEGVHVGQQDFPPHETRQLIGPDKWLGLSVSSLDELKDVPHQGVDYLGVGPVFATTSKPDAPEPIGIDQLQRIVQASFLPTVAIGGINESKMTAVLKTNVTGVAVVSAICGQSDPAFVTHRLMACYAQLKR